MLTLNGDRVRHIDEQGDAHLDRAYVTIDHAGTWSVLYAPLDPDDLPDLRDAATIGAINEVLHRITGKTFVYCLDADLGDFCIKWIDDPEHVHTNNIEDALINAFEKVEGGDLS
jgi:hypothetical protein